MGSQLLYLSRLRRPQVTIDGRPRRRAKCVPVPSCLLNDPRHHSTRFCLVGGESNVPSLSMFNKATQAVTVLPMSRTPFRSPSRFFLCSFFFFFSFFFFLLLDEKLTLMTCSKVHVNCLQRRKPKAEVLTRATLFPFLFPPNRSHIGPHCDTLSNIGPGAIVTGISLGAKRVFMVQEMFPWGTKAPAAGDWSSGGKKVQKDKD